MRLALPRRGASIAWLVIVASAAHAEAPTRERDPLEWGVYQIYWSRSYEDVLQRELAKLGGSPQYVMFYRDLPRPFPADAVESIRRAGAVPIVSLELWHWHDTSTKFVPKINAGLFDDRFREWARAAKQAGGRVLLRFGFEFNGDWFSWGGDPVGFVEAWRRVHGLFREQGAENVEWVWAANVTSHPGGADNSMHRYYPGDAFVDWVAVDGYNWGDEHKPWHKWRSAEELFEDVLDEFDRRYADKPIMIAEIGCPEGAGDRKAEWIREAYAYFRRRGQVRAVVWFNLDKRREGELNFRLDSSVGALRAFNDTFAAPR